MCVVENLLASERPRIVEQRALDGLCGGVLVFGFFEFEDGGALGAIRLCESIIDIRSKQENDSKALYPWPWSSAGATLVSVP